MRKPSSALRPDILLEETSVIHLMNMAMFTGNPRYSIPPYSFGVARWYGGRGSVRCGWTTGRDGVVRYSVRRHGKAGRRSLLDRPLTVVDALLVGGTAIAVEPPRDGCRTARANEAGVEEWWPGRLPDSGASAGHRCRPDFLDYDRGQW